jgi:predicted RNase H-like nuclease (RuvC/YqgF family)
MAKLYRQVTLTDEQEDEFVFAHKMAMTGESLHSKSEIAYELGLRDKRIAELEKALQRQIKRVKLLEPLLESNPSSQDTRDLEQHDKGVDSAIAELTICYRVALDEHKDYEDAEVLEGLIDRLQALKESQ